MLLYKHFCFSEVMDQIFLTARGAVQGSFRATHSSLCLCSCRLTWGAWRCFPPLGFFLGVYLYYMNFFGGIFDL